VWHALTDAELTSRFWGHAQVSDWVVGGRVDHVRTDGSAIADASGLVIEADRPHRLMFDIETYRDIVKITLTHTSLPSLDGLHTAGQGWPSLLANLKTLLETGDVLPQEPWEFHAEERASHTARNGEPSRA
jgi:uncharacterized protein YndB with AHSA1/START domain